MSTQINLFNPDLLPRKASLPASHLPWVLGAGLMVCFAVTGWVSIRTTAAQAEATQAAQEMSPLVAESQLLQSRINANKPDAQLQREVSQLERKLQLRQQAIALLTAEGDGGERGFSGRLITLSRHAIEGLWLTTIDVTGDQVSLLGQTVSAEKLPRWMSSLRSEPSFSGSAFEVFTLTQQAAETDPKSGSSASPSPAPSLLPPNPAAIASTASLPYQFVLRGRREPGARTEARKAP